MAETTRSVKMFLNLDVNAQQASKAASTFGTAMKGALGLAMTGAMGLAARSPEIRASVASMFTGATEGLKKSLGGFMGNLGVSAGTAGSAAGAIGSGAASVGRFAWNHPRIAGAALGGMGGGIPGMLGGAAPNFGRFLASSGGAAIGGAVAGPLGAIGGAAGGMFGGVGGAAAGIAMGGAATAVLALASAAKEAASMLAGMVALTDPATAKEFERVMADTSAIIGDTFKPALEFVIGYMREWADLMAANSSGMKDAIGSIMDLVKVGMIPTMTVMKVAMPVVNIALKALAIGIDALLWPFKQLGEAINYILELIPGVGSKGASENMAGSAAAFGSIDSISRNVQQAAFSRGITSREERLLIAAEKTAEHTGRIRAPSRHQDINDATLGGQR